MATKTKKKKGLTREQYKKIWNQISTNEWLSICKDHHPTSQFHKNSSEIIKGCCPHPDHADNAPSFYIHTVEHRAKCFGCGYFVSNPIELMSTIMGKTDVEALQFIQDNFNVQAFLPKRLQADLEAQRTNQKAKNAIYQYTHDMLCDAIANPAAHAYATTAVDWLVNVRKVPQEHLHALPVGIMPPLLQLVDGMSKKYQSNFHTWRKASKAKNAANKPGRAPEDFSGIASTYLASCFKNSDYHGSIVFPLHSTPRDIARIKLRQPLAPGLDKKFVIPEDDFEESLGIYGLGWNMYDTFFTQDNTKDGSRLYTYLVEGEMDALTMMAQFMVNDSILFPIMSVGGTGGSRHIEPILQTTGVTKAFMIGDSPASNGDVIVKEWLSRVPEVHARVFTGWDKLVPSTDLDDAVHNPQIGYDKVLEVIWKNAKDNFTFPWKWAYSQVVPVLDSIPDHDRRSLIEQAAEFGKYLQQRDERNSYIQEISDNYPQVPDKILQRAMARREDNELGFIAQCADALRDLFFVVGTRIRATGRYLILQHRRNKTFHEMRLNSGDTLSQELAPLVGSVFHFVDQDVGFPSFLTHPRDSDRPIMSKTNKDLTSYMVEGVNELCHGTLDLQTAVRRKQGYHYIERERRDNLEYIVCGRDVFKITRDSTDAPTYVKLDGPTDEDLIFDVYTPGEPPPVSWYPGGLTTDLLDEGTQIDLNQLFDNLVDYYKSAFTFKNQDVTSELLAALLMSYPIMDALERPVMLFITGDTRSGKSTLLATIAGNKVSTKLAKCRIYHPAYEIQDYTAPGLARSADLSSQVVVLDEFELGDEDNGKRAQSILSMLRAMINGEVTRMRAKPDGVGISTTTLRMPIIFAAITGAEKPEDINRMIIIEMQQVEGHEAPAQILDQKFGQAKIQEIAQGLNTAMYTHAMTLRKHYYEISDVYREIEKSLPVAVDYRYMSSLFGPLAVMKMLGRDWKKFLINFVTKNEIMINIANTASVSEALLNRILNADVIYNHDTHQSEAVGMLITNADRWDEINKATCGIFFDKTQSLLLLLMDQIILKYFKGEKYTPLRLKEALQRHKLALKAKDVGATGIVGKARALLGPGVTPNGVVVIQAKELIKATQDAAQMHALLDPDEAEDTNEEEEDSDTSNIQF